MNTYTMGETYRKNTINVAAEMIPQNAAFKSFPGEKHFFEEREGKVTFYQVTSALESGFLTELDKNIICLIATFGSACVTSKMLKEMLLMMDVKFSDNMFESSIKRLRRFHLINFSHFAIDGREPAKMRIITLANYGSQLAKSLGIVHRFNAIATASAEAYAVKSRAQTAQLISNYLKNRVADSFSVRPVIVVNPDIGAIIRPAATITIQGEQLFFEVPRRRDGWLEDLEDKLNRYLLVFEGKTLPTVVINGEDEAMNREVAEMIRARGFEFELLYTDDLAMFGPKFRYSLYGFAEDGTKLCYSMNIEDAAA